MRTRKILGDIKKRKERKVKEKNGRKILGRDKGEKIGEKERKEKLGKD